MKISPRSASPHIGKFDRPVIDFNGVGEWSVEGIRIRYESLALRLGVKSQAHLTPHIHREGERTWIYPLIGELLPLVELGDRAAIEIGVQFIEEDEFFVFGKILKSNMARARRRAELTPEQQHRIRQRIVGMLLRGDIPHEFHEYKRLLRRVGLGDMWPILDERVDRTNKYVMRHYEYLDRFARQAPTV